MTSRVVCRFQVQLSKLEEENFEREVRELFVVLCALKIVDHDTGFVRWQLSGRTEVANIDLVECERGW